MAAEQWGSGIKVGEHSEQACYSIVRQQLTEIGEKVIILTAFDKSLTQNIILLS